MPAMQKKNTGTWGVNRPTTLRCTVILYLVRKLYIGKIKSNQPSMTLINKEGRT